MRANHAFHDVIYAAADAPFVERLAKSARRSFFTHVVWAAGLEIDHLYEQNDLQQKLASLERKQRKQRQQIFEVEDQIAEKRDALIASLQRRMSQKTKVTPLFTIQPTFRDRAPDISLQLTP